MDDKRGSRADQAIPLMGLAAIIATSLGYYLWLEPLKTFRPPIEDPPKPPLERNLPARLWQDPIAEARRSYAAQNGPDPAQGETDPIHLERRDHVLMVQMYGGYSQLDYETRLRTRYAVGLALERAGFQPDGSDTEFLRFRTIELSADPNHAERKTAKVIPYEYWDPSVSRGVDCQTETQPRVLVLWVGDDISLGNPLHTMQAVFKEVVRTEEPRLPLRIIGPTSSGGLAAMVQEITDTTNQSPPKPGQFVVYSPWATADDAFLFSPPVRNLPDMIQRTIANDRIVAGYLLRELSIRHVDLSVTGQDEIAVLSEWDTQYGRSLPVTFAACLLLHKEQGLNCEQLGASKAFGGGKQLDSAEQFDMFRRATRRVLQDPEAWPPSLKRVIYLRGLDGIGPRSGPNDAKGSEKARGDSKTAELERPDGSSQLDYARRLAEEIARPGGRKLRAVGVLGSDIYDKLLLLQALSERLPDVLFFTTDLDASYLHSSQSAWTRNLLVGSSFPLNVGESSAGAKLSPPFRDVYGTAVFHATLRAVKDLSCRAQASIQEMESDPLKAAVYEIGRTEAHRLDQEPRSVLERLQPLWKLWIWLLLLALILPALHMLMTGDPAIRVLGMVVGTGLLFQILYLQFGDAEPLHWIEGISIWPSEMCRMMAAALALLFLTWVRTGLAKNRESLCLDFGYTIRPPWPELFSRPWWQRLTFLLTHRWTQPLNIRPIWDLYDEHDRPTYRYFRAGVLTVVTILFVWWARIQENAPRPCRGDSCTADSIITFFSISAQFLLLYVVVDVTLACCRWIVALRDTRNRGENDAGQGYPTAWIEIELIARRTQEVSRLVLYPFMTLPLLIIAQFSFFDRWNWPISLLVIYASLLALALAAAMILRRCAETARARACEEVRALRVSAIERNDPERAARLESALREIEAETRGAFSALSENPVLAAVLLPISGAGTGLALDSLLKTF